jgi:hypothetical protein
VRSPYPDSDNLPKPNFETLDGIIGKLAKRTVEQLLATIPDSAPLGIRRRR